MNSRDLIRHTEALLKEHESIRLGLVKNELVTDRLTQPIAMEEEDILEKYLEINKISGKNECAFIRETYLGCIKRGAFLEATLQRFLAQYMGIYLQKDYYLYAIICYLALWRIEEIGFSAFSKFVRCFDPKKMASLIDFLFQPSNIEGVLKPLWCTILDGHFVRDKIIHHILQHSSNALLFQQDLIKFAQNGMEIKKTQKITKQDPFLLTVPKPRRLPQPTHVIPTSTKARPIPKSLFSIPKEQLALDSKKIISREKSKKLYEEAQTHQFKVALKLQSDKKELIREKIKSEEVEKQEKMRPRRIKKETNMMMISNVKSTTAAVLREEVLLRKKRKEQQEMIAAAEMGLQDAERFEMWKEKLKIKEQEEKLVDLERKRLEVQLLHEETFQARKDLIQENKEKVAGVIAEKKEIKQMGEEFKKEVDQANQRKIEDVHAIKESALKAKQMMVKEKVKNAVAILNEKRKMQMQIQQEQKEELERKALLIQQIRLLELSQLKTASKEVDLTQSSGLGLLGEMSIAELQERLVVAKSKETEDAEQKRKEIQLLKTKKEEELQLKLQRIDNERQERRQKRISKSLPDRGLSSLSVASNTTSFKDMLFEKDETGELKSLQAKILEKRRKRIAERSKVASKIIDNITEPNNNPIDELERARRNWELEKQQIESLKS